MTSQTFEVPDLRIPPAGEPLPGTKQSPIVVHISGIPGSGKSYLGEQIARKLKLCVVDTDDLLKPDTPFGKILIALEKLGKANPAYLARWREIFSSQIQGEIDKAKADDVGIIIFVGILNHWGHGDKPITITEPVTKFYLFNPMPRLLFYYYTRYAKESPSEEDPFWSDLAEGRDEIPSSKSYMNDAVEIQRWHEEHGYVPQTFDEIFQEISKLRDDLSMQTNKTPPSGTGQDAARTTAHLGLTL